MPLFPRPQNESPFLRPELIATWREIISVLLLTLAPFVAMSAWAASHGSQHRYFQVFLSDESLLLNGATEAAILGLALLYFHRRGWTPADLRIRPNVASSLQGIILAPLTLLANALVVFGLFILLFTFQLRYRHFPRFIMAHSPQLGHLHAHHLSWTVLIAAMILNAFLEEIICTAYAFNQFAARRGPLFALVLVVLLRMACHTYQGVTHVLGIGTVFLIFGLWYWRTRNVWTLVFAHALIDIGSLSAIKLLGH